MTLVQSIGARVQSEPAYAAGAVMATINLLVVFNVVTLTGEQIASINTAVAAILAFVVRRAVSPTGAAALGSAASTTAAARSGR